MSLYLPPPPKDIRRCNKSEFVSFVCNLIWQSLSFANIPPEGDATPKFLPGVKVSGKLQADEDGYAIRQIYT